MIFREKIKHFVEIITLAPSIYTMDYPNFIVSNQKEEFICTKRVSFLLFLNKTIVLLDFSLTVKAATLIFISGRGSAISSAKEGKSGFIYN